MNKGGAAPRRGQAGPQDCSSLTSRGLRFIDPPLPVPDQTVFATILDMSSCCVIVVDGLLPGPSQNFVLARGTKRAKATHVSQLEVAICVWMDGYVFLGGTALFE